MEWYKLFRQHILDRGIEYFEDGEVIDFLYSNNEIKASVNGSNVYEVEISLDEEVLAEEDMEKSNNDNGIDVKCVDFYEKVNKQKIEVIDLVSKIPEEKVRELLVGYVLAD